MKKTRVKIIHEGDYFSEVPIEIEESAGPWAPYVSVEEARKLDSVRRALRRKDIAEAGKFGKVYRVTEMTGYVRNFAVRG